MEQPFKQLHSLRKSRKLKQEDVAKMAGISREAYLRAESGRADPRLSTLMAVTSALGLEVVLAPREAVTEIERVMANYPPQPSSTGTGGQARLGTHHSISSPASSHGGASHSQYRGPEHSPQPGHHDPKGSPQVGSIGSAGDHSRKNETGSRPATDSPGVSGYPGRSGSHES